MHADFNLAALAVLRGWQGA